MPIREVIKILIAYQRYVDYMNNHGFDDAIESIKENYNSLLITMRGHMGETYENEVYLSEKNEELCIESAVTHVSVFDVLDLEEYGVTEDVLHYLKYGKYLPMSRKNVDHYLMTNGSDIIDQIADYEIQDILYGYDDRNEIIAKLDELISSHREYTEETELPFIVGDTKSDYSGKDILVAVTDLTFMVQFM